MQIYDNDIVKELKEELVEKHKDWLWSNRQVGVERVSEKLLIEKYLHHGDEHQWEKLKRAFKKADIKRVWINSGGLSGSRNNNHEVARFFFSIRNPEKYQERKQREYIASFCRD
ncbi:hypothetical protein JMN32_21065 [Fulvivirga sp. 29W222]|uniref:Uncharacterized protein n=1 Tax=Fulvivirga marina TaxID=2494733 RepID=A0A937KD59_9BACT|nr:hypothetical protein [Fulvivirga marina]MBL6448816.1 hypothetical protein [Fulvivirga marina]